MPEPARESSRKTLAHVLVEEVKLLRGSFPARPGATVADVYEGIADLSPGAPLSALCLSGGGIRSATFNLGVLEALARAGILGSFDYLSTVSGGGYIGAWLQAWMRRERDTAGNGGSRPGEKAREAVISALAGQATPRDPLRPEPKPIDRLREFSNYLTPRCGPLSTDTWTVAAIVLRNLLLNWLVIVPLLAFVVMIPQAAYLLSAARDLGQPAWSRYVAWAALGIGLVSSVATHWMRARVRGIPLAPDPERRWTQRRGERRVRWVFDAASIGCLYAASTLFVVAALWADAPWQAIPGGAGAPAGAPQFPERMARALTWTIGLPLLGAAIGKTITRQWRRPTELVAELVAFVVSGLLGAALLAWLMGDPWAALVQQPWLVTVLGVPALLVVYALARAVFTGVRSVADDLGRASPAYAEADREWWSRLTGRALLLAALWAGASALVLVGVWALGHPAALFEGLRTWVGAGIAAVGGTSAIVAALLGKSPQTASGRTPEARTSRRKERAFRAAAAATVASVVVVLSIGTGWLGRKVTGDTSLLALGFADPLADGWEEVGRFFALGGGLVVLSAVAGAFVNVNRFSLHGLYRNRLVRAYLGASNVDRRPNPFSGFDPEDDALHLADLRPPLGETARLLPIVNVTLNLLAGERLAWQERKAESFSMTPLFCGNFHQGYRDTRHYGRRDGGIRLGAAMAISGAAANPNMGYVSTPALTFLMGLLNARLGVWLPNPGDQGDGVVSRPAPRHAAAQLLRELLGLTDGFSPWVNLSDGGHFDNLGLYEVVLRRCRRVVVSDAGCDPPHGYGDLGNAIRKIRVDFGIPITFEREIAIPARGEKGKAGPGVLCAIGTIHYEAVDGPGTERGTLVYLKPTLAARPERTVPYDVQAYATTHGRFPHESTVDQAFSESQFEGYRALGEHVVHTLLGEGAVTDWRDFLRRVRTHLDDGVPPRPPAPLHAVP